MKYFSTMSFRKTKSEMFSMHVCRTCIYTKHIANKLVALVTMNLKLFLFQQLSAHYGPLKHNFRFGYTAVNTGQYPYF